MINFVICEDEEILLKKYCVEIEKFMMNYDIDYKFHTYNGYNEAWKKYAQTDDGFKVYLLDIRTEEGSGLDAARRIREEYDDWVSMIIIISSYSEYKYEALGKRLMLVDFINKLDRCEAKLIESLLICIKHYNNRHKVLRYTYKNTAYSIELRHILYIEREPESKVCKIVTIYGTYPIQGTIKSVLKNLDSRFFKSCRGTIVNSEQIVSYNKKLNKIKFKTGEETDSVSRDNKKEVVRYVRGLR